jgi:hypothetical protein
MWVMSSIHGVCLPRNSQFRLVPLYSFGENAIFKYSLKKKKERKKRHIMDTCIHKHANSLGGKMPFFVRKLEFTHRWDYFSALTAQTPCSHFFFKISK